MTKTSAIIVGAKSFTSNVYDGDTMEEVLSRIKAVCGIAPETAYCDRRLRVFQGRLNKEEIK
jgi:hypothetical protein